MSFFQRRFRKRVWVKNKYGRWRVAYVILTSKFEQMLQDPEAPHIYHEALPDGTVKGDGDYLLWKDA